MSNRLRESLNATFFLAGIVQCVAVIVFLTVLRADVDVIKESLVGIRADFKAVQAEIQKLDVRATRLEEQMRLRGSTGDAYNRFRE